VLCAFLPLHQADLPSLLCFILCSFFLPPPHILTTLLSLLPVSSLSNPLLLTPSLVCCFHLLLFLAACALTWCSFWLLLLSLATLACSLGAQTLRLTLRMVRIIFINLIYVFTSSFNIIPIQYLHTCLHLPLSIATHSYPWVYGYRFGSDLQHPQVYLCQSLFAKAAVA
jgi:hypothetical protein